MTAYYVMIALIALLTFGFGKSNKMSTPFLVCVFFVLLFFAVARSLLVGTDTLMYYGLFENAPLYSNDRHFTGTQRGWYYLNLALSKWANYDVFLIVCYSLIIGGLLRYIRYNSVNFFISTIIFFLLFYCQSYNGMRQYIAVAIIAAAYVFIDKNRKYYIMWLCIALLFHFSAFIGIFPLFHKKLNMNRRFLVVAAVVVSFIFGIFLQDYVKQLFSLLMFVEDLNEGASGYFREYGAQRNFGTNFLINMVFLITYLLARRKNMFSLKLYFAYIVLWNLWGASEQGGRLVWYFQIGMMAAIPNVYTLIREKIIAKGYLILILAYCFAIWYIQTTTTSDLNPYIFRI